MSRSIFVVLCWAVSGVFVLGAAAYLACLLIFGHDEQALIERFSIISSAACGLFFGVMFGLVRVTQVRANEAAQRERDGA